MQYEARTLMEPSADKITALELPHSPPSVDNRRSMRLQTRSGQGDGRPDRFLRKILVPTDFSPCSARALEFAVSLATQCQAALTILHVIDINMQSAHGLPDADSMKRLWEAGFQELGKLAFALNGRVDAQTAVEEGLPCELIIEKSRGADLLVLGKPGPKPGWKLFSKHTAQRVIEHAACPVILVQDRN